METRANLEPETLERIRDLVRINVDSEKGFLNAAERLNNPALENQFRRHAEERRRNAVELRTIVEMNDAEAEDFGSIVGRVHRWWIDLRAAVSSHDERAMLREAVRGEATIKAVYEEVLKDTAGSAINDLLLRQYRGIKEVHNQIRLLSDLT